MRVSWKIPVVLKGFSKKIILNRAAWLSFLIQNNNYRKFTICKTLVGKTIYVHNGAFSDSIKIGSKMIGHKIGEFSITKILGKEFHLAREGKKKKKKKKIIIYDGINKKK